MFRAGSPDTAAESKRYGACAPAGRLPQINAIPVNPALNIVTNPDFRADDFMFGNPLFQNFVFVQRTTCIPRRTQGS
jgi:hypothetical protein